MGAIDRKGGRKAGDVRAGILVTGNEVVNATIRDENSPWLAEELAGLGIAVDRVLIVPDDAEAIEEGLQHLAARDVDMIITSGGLGPTEDDKTAASVARFAGREMLLDPDMERKIAGILSRYAAARGVEVPKDGLDEANRKQAMVPVGSTPLDPVGTAPGLVVPGPGGVVVVVLPGPPRELRPMWSDAVGTEAVSEVVGRAEELDLLRLRLFGLPESRLADELRKIEESGADFADLEVTTCLRKGELEVDIRFRPAAAGRAEALGDALIEAFPVEIFSTDGTTIDQIVSDLLLEGPYTLSVAESCTAGLLAARISAVPGASRYFIGGAVTYSNDAKESMVGVGRTTLEEYGAVSPETALEMASGIRSSLGTDIGVSITGIAGPDGGSAEKPVGFVCFHVDGGDLGSIELAPTIPGGRNDIRERSALVALHLIRRLLQDSGG